MRNFIIDNLLFCPEKAITEDPSAYGLDFEEIFVPTSNKNILHGFYIPAKEKTENTFIYLHGTNGSVSTYLRGVSKLHQSGANVLIADYQGFGKSSGKAAIKNTINDSIDIYDFLVNYKKTPKEKINLFGYSYGGAVATELALRKKVNAMVLECTFSSLKKISKKYYPLISDILVPPNILNTIHNINKISCPKLIAYAEHDDVVPNSHSKEIYEAIIENKFLHEIKKAKHADICDHITDEYICLIKDLITN